MNWYAPLAITAVTLLVLGLAAGYVKKRLFISEPAIALLVGIALGPAVSGLFRLETVTGEPLRVLEEVARVTLIVSVMGSALRLPAGYVQRHTGELAIVLTAGMGLMWLASAAITYFLLSMPLLVALAIGAAVTPTDPVLADSIVTGRRAERLVPGRLRHSISAESGANDGLALLMVMLPVTLLQHVQPAPIEHWLIHVVLGDVLGGALLGLVLGAIAGFGLRWISRRQLAESTSILTVSLALALTVLALGRLLGVDSILAVFIAGVVLGSSISSREDMEQENIQEAVGRFFNLPIFILFGTLLPWQDWVGLGWWGLGATILVLLLRRLPAWWLLWRALPSLVARRDMLFNGWFGPIGISALFYAALVHQKTGNEMVWPVVSLVVFLSTLVHGISATPLTGAYGRSANRPE